MTIDTKLAALKNLTAAQTEYIDRWVHWAEMFVKMEPLFLRTGVVMTALKKALLAGEMTSEQCIDKMSVELCEFWADARLIDSTAAYYVDKVFDGG